MRRRKPAVAGLFYPDDPKKIDAFMQPFATTSGEMKTRILIGPHAGYVYSGGIAGDGYAKVHVPDRVIILGPNHTGAGHTHAVYARGAFAMPGGDVPIAEALAKVMIDEMALVDDERAHAQEHSIEVHLPFLVAKNPDVQIVPVCLGHLSFAACESMGNGLARVMASHDEVLVVVSTDMSHYEAADEAARLDKMALDQVEALEAENLYQVVQHNHISMCGFIPTTVALVAARKLGYTRANIIRYGNSGEASGDYHRVVGYAAATVS